MKKINIIIVIIILVCLSIVFTMTSKFNNKEDDIKNNNETNIEELKYQTGATADDNLYEIQKDLDGRDILVIKEEMAYKVALAGILTQEKPTYENSEEIINKQNIHSGIWISNESREKISYLIQKYLEDEYEIDEEGYLVLKTKTQNSNSYDINLQKCIQDNKIYIISVLGKIYEIDNMTGEIVLYPFEQMDAYQLCEPIEYEDKKIIVLSTNKQNKLSEQELIEAMIEQMIM